MSVEGKKIKLHVGKMKEAIDALSVENNVTRDMLLQCFRLLLISEISQRGVIVPLDASDEQILPAIVNIAGKSLIDEKNVKSPLIAGAAAVSAMIAEKCACLLLQMNSSLTTTILKKDQWVGAFQRCRDVNDGRLMSLLDIATKLNLGKEGTEMDNCHAKITSLLLHRVAYGNYLRACAFSNPEQPPVFKRALESCLQGQALLAHLRLHDADRDILTDDEFSNYYTHDAITPLQTLVRIALIKNNVKRVNELYLRLVQSYIGDGENDGCEEFLSADGSKLWNEVKDSFIIPYNGDANGSSGDSLQLRIQYAIKAKELIDKVKDIHFDRESDLKLIILHKLLVLQVMSLHEDILVSIISNQRHVASINRTGLSVGTATMAAFETQARKDLIAGRLSSNDIDRALVYDSVSFNTASMALCKCFLSIEEENDLLNLPSRLVDAVCVTIERQLERLILAAQAIALDRMTDDDSSKNVIFHSWNNVYQLIEPLLDSITAKDEESVGKAIKEMSKSRQSLMVAVSEGLFVYVWMTYFEAHVENSQIEVAAIIVSNVLMLMKEEQVEDILEKDKLDFGAGKVLKINNNNCFNDSYMRVEMLCRASKYQRYLLLLGEFDLLISNCLKCFQSHLI